MISHFGINERDHTILFQKELYARLLNKNSILDHAMSTPALGKNFSCFICERAGLKLLVLLDADDGSGGTPADCKLVWRTYQSILDFYKPHDMIVLKSQVNRDPECNQFYPFKQDIYPIGIFSNNPYGVFERKQQHPKQLQDIDVFYAGGYKHARNRPYVWPKHRDVRKWWAGSSIRGYEKLLEIKSRRPDIKFALFDDVVPPDQFYSLLRRSKICIDLPGVGLSSRKFYECMVFGKCVISLRQQFTPWPCEENEHYISLGEDWGYDDLESKIDLALKNDSLRAGIESKVEEIEPHLKLDAMISRVKNIINKKLDSMNDSYILQY